MTQVYRVTQRRSRLARAVAGMDEKIVGRDWRPRRELTSQEKMLARRMARNPKTRVEDIALAIGWTLSRDNLWKKLRDVNIRCVGGNIMRYLQTYETTRG